MDTKQRIAQRDSIAAGIARFLAQHPDLVEQYVQSVIDCDGSIYTVTKNIADAMDAEHWLDSDWDVRMFCDATQSAVESITPLPE